MPELSRDALQFVAKVQGLSPRIFRVLSVHLSAGTKFLDYAVVAFDLGDPTVQQFVQNITLGKLTFRTDQGQLQLSGREMTIEALVDGKGQSIHWGRITVVEPTIGADEALILLSRVENVHFGTPLGFQRVFDPITNALTYLDHEVVFNPEIKGAIVGNKRINSKGADLKYPVFIDPRSVATPAAILFQGAAITAIDLDLYVHEQAAENWSLLDAVRYLCGECNAKEKYIKNPTVNVLQGILPEDRAILKNHQLRRGLYLNEALAALLEPYGFQARIKYPSVSRREIQIVENGVGTRRTVKHQPPGQLFDPAKTEVEHLELQFDSSMAINQVTATGSYTEIEASFELKPAWTAAQDSIPLQNVIKGNPAWELHPEYHRIHRDWVLNEGADYPRGWRDASANSGNPELTKLFRAVFGQDHPPIVPKRSKFHPMLTRGSDGQPLGDVGGLDVEWWNPNKAGGADWDKLNPHIPFFACRVLTDECGISFSGPQPPVLIMRQGPNARVRVTATFRSDTRIRATAARKTTSVNVDVHEQLLDVASRFHARLLHSGSKYYSDVRGARRQADQTDGRAALQVFVDEARGAFDAAQCSGKITLEGCDHLEYEVGDLITGIAGRAVTFSLNNSNSVDGRYPQIVGITYDVQNQKTDLIANEFKNPDAWVASFIRKTRKLK